MKHGTRYGYDKKGCRCQACLAWKADRYAAQRRRANPGWVPVADRPAPPVKAGRFALTRPLPGMCSACQGRYHGPDCRQGGCICGCAALGFRGPFGLADPTAPDEADLRGRVA